MNTSFYNGISGTISHQYSIDVISNNIANINTVGYKSSEAEFSSLFSKMLSQSETLPTTNQIGLGSRINATALDMSQGSLQNTDRPFDLAIGGDGWFAIDYNGETLYTRNGGFSLDQTEYLSDNNGGYLLGATADNIIKTNDGKYTINTVDSIPLTSTVELKKIFMPTELSMPAEPTTYVKINGNLDSSKNFNFVTVELNNPQYNESINDTKFSINGSVTANNIVLDPKEGDTIFVTLTNSDGKEIVLQTQLDKDLNWSINDADISELDPINKSPITVEKIEINTYQEVPNEAHFATPLILETGEKGVLDMNFTKVVPQSESGVIWNGTMKILDSNGNVIDSKDGTLTFDSNGALISNSFAPLQRADGGTIDVILGTPYNENIEYSGFDGVVSLVSSSSLYEEEHDGYFAGELKEYVIENNGIVYAIFDNGKSSPIANIPVYHFQNDQGLEKIGSNYFQYTPNSGKAFLYTDENGEAIKTIYSNKLENSNVDLSQALTELIVMQKAFDANAKSITTSDQMIQQAINMKK
ncbi:flagellar hook-basal body complex protein [Hydrogenimonas thermophila]|uniref:flagellar hook protein FlgE n=1 Tax=Hydrogenimonas thermophila TaxID=223786 RepID=UPI002937327F|nr:flagellar hook-basal body complex protein [Hydrogenimonas thermophila]WOE69985.1 flagellar hook-basal body complex protein [Hydrogenimonas thermophila]WOE72502.1 flagellar hook-basal body complex protein [Hydrogenimonas thermophila]